MKKMMMMKTTKRRSFGSIGGRVDATFFYCFSLSLSLSLSRGVVARVYIFASSFCAFFSLSFSLLRFEENEVFGFLKHLGFVISL
jgi:hypothetical protein